MTDLRQAFVYVIGEEGGPYKVGFAENPTTRLGFLKSASPLQLELFHAAPVRWRDRQVVEKYAHALLWSARQRGEWFSVTKGQAIRAVELAVAGVAAGKLPPGPTIDQKRGTTRKRLQRELAATPLQRRAWRHYEGLVERTGLDRRAAALDGQPIIEREDLKALHGRVATQCGPTALTVLSAVVGHGRAIDSLPGSYRQHHMLRRLLFQALDCVSEGLTD